MKKVLALLLTMAMTVTTLVGCGGTTDTATEGAAAETEVAAEGEEAAAEEAAPTFDMSETVKIGVLVSDATTAESLAFRSYYTEYIQNQYNVELIYSDELVDAAGETSAIDTFITNNCKAIISFSSFDRAAQIDQ